MSDISICGDGTSVTRNGRIGIFRGRFTIYDEKDAKKYIKENGGLYKLPRTPRSVQECMTDTDYPEG